MKTLIIYIYIEDSSIQSKDNLLFFCNHGVFPNENKDYIFITESFDNIKNLIPEYTNVKIIKEKYENNLFSFWNKGLLNNNNEEYDYYGFINSFSKGPFLPNYIDSSNWHLFFINLLNTSVKLVGTTINYQNEKNIDYPYINLDVFFTDKTGLEILKKSQVFEKNNIELLSFFILNQGYTIDCLCPIQRSKDNNNNNSNKNFLKNKEIISSLINYNNLNPLDVIFIKTNINHCNENVKKYTKLQNYEQEMSFIENPFSLQIRNELNNKNNNPYYKLFPFILWLIGKINPKIIISASLDFKDILSLPKKGQILKTYKNINKIDILHIEEDEIFDAIIKQVEIFLTEWSIIFITGRTIILNNKIIETSFYKNFIDYDKVCIITLTKNEKLNYLIQNEWIKNICKEQDYKNIKYDI